MAVTQIFCWSVIVWCYILIIIDMFNGALYSMKYFESDEVEPWEAKSDWASFWHREDKCLVFGLRKLMCIVEMSLLIISVFALAALCCKKAILLLPYLILKLAIIFMYIYMCIQYSIYWNSCQEMLLPHVFTLLFSFFCFSVVAVTYRVITTEYEVVHETTFRKQ